MKMEKRSKRKNPRVFFALLLFALAMVSCESPRLVKHPVSLGDVYYYYATYYDDKFVGKGMANGEAFSNDAMTCAAKGFPFGTVLEVQSLDTGKKTEVVVTDRPGKNGLDLTKKAFGEVDDLGRGRFRAKVKVIGVAKDAKPAPKKEEKVQEEPKKQEESKQEEKEQPEKKAETKAEPEKTVSYTIVLAAFGDMESAKTYQSSIPEADTYIFTSDGKFEVRYGRYSAKEDAEADKNRYMWKDAEVIVIE